MRAGSASTPRFSPSALISPNGRTFPRAMRRRSSTPSPCCAAWRRGEPPQLGRRVVVYGGGNTALDVARTAKRLGRERSAHRLPPHARTDARARIGTAGSARRRRHGALAQHDQERRRDDVHRREDGARRHRVFRSRRASSRCSKPTRSSSRSGKTPIFRCSRTRADIAVDDGVVSVDANMMTGVPGIFAGGDMVPAERTVTVAVGHGKKAARNIDAYLHGTRYEAAPEARACHATTSSTRGITATLRKPSSRRSTCCGAARPSKK